MSVISNKNLNFMLNTYLQAGHVSKELENKTNLRIEIKTIIKLIKKYFF